MMGGTFNPPHIGHLICAQEALTQMALDRVVWVPVNIPPHKTAVSDPGPDARVAMCRLATEGDERIGVSTIEVERAGPSYTVDTLEQIKRETPEQDLTFIMGGDMALSLPRWKSPARLLELAQVAVAERDEIRREHIAHELRMLPGSERVRFFSMPRVDVSSSTVRARAAAGLPLRYLVPDAVAEMIGDRGLYKVSNEGVR